jgi:exportin-7
MWIIFQAMTRALSGNYVNFGVFDLYGDRCLQDALTVVLKLATAVPALDMLAYPRLYRAYYAMLEMLFMNQGPTILQRDTATFLSVIGALSEGISHVDIRLAACLLVCLSFSLSLNLFLHCCAHVQISTQSCSALDFMLSYVFANRMKDTPAVLAFNQHVSAQPGMLSTISFRSLHDLMRDVQICLGD